MAKKILALICAALLLLSVCSCNTPDKDEGTTTPAAGGSDLQTPNNTEETTPTETPVETPDNAENSTPAPDVDETTPQEQSPEEPSVTTEREYTKLY